MTDEHQPTPQPNRRAGMYGDTQPNQRAGAYADTQAARQPDAPFHPEFQKLIHSRWRFRAYLFMNIPSAFRSGLDIESIDAERAAISIPFKRFTKNPFRSIYFACLAMAAEMSTGILAMGFIYKQQKVSMLVTGLEARFIKKATGKVVFTCSDGQSIKNTIDNAVISGEPQVITAHAV